MTAAASAETIYLNVGRCLAEWSRVEFGVALLFVGLNNRRFRANDPLLASFEANRSFDAKRKTLRTFVMSDDGCSAIFRERFEALDRKLSRMAAKRSEVAHFTIRTHHSQDCPSGRAMLHPFGTFTGNFFDRETAPLTGEEVGQRAEAFGALAERVFRFVAYVKNTRDLLDPHDAPFENPEELLAHPFIGKAPAIATLG